MLIGLIAKISNSRFPLWKLVGHLLTSSLPSCSHLDSNPKVIAY